MKSRRMCLALVMAGAGAGAVAACERSVSLETETFPLRYLNPDNVIGIIDPYVYGDRDGSPGQLSISESAVTVRETRDNLDRIGRVLAEFDVPPKRVTLHFQLIAADGQSPPDAAIADVEQELRKLFRFDGYQLVGEATVTGTPRSMSSQVIGRGTSTRGPGEFMLRSEIGRVAGSGDSAVVEVGVYLTGGGATGEFTSTVNVGVGKVVVLGTTNVLDVGALIVAVRADVIEM